MTTKYYVTVTMVLLMYWFYAQVYKFNKICDKLTQLLTFNYLLNLQTIIFYLKIIFIYQFWIYNFWKFIVKITVQRVGLFLKYGY